MFSRLLPPNLYRSYLSTRLRQGPLARYLQHPFPSRGQTVEATEFLALDFETTGLDVRKDAILSAGYTLIRNGRVVLGENGHHIVRVEKTLSRESVIIHKITDDRMRHGMPLGALMDILLEKLAGRVLLVHYAPVETGFLNAASRRLYGHGLPLMIADTMAIERRRLERRHIPIEPGKLRLFNLRREYGLPRYNAHSALEDAIATAELFLAQTAHMGNGKPVPIKMVLG